MLGELLGLARPHCRRCRSHRQHHNSIADGGSARALYKVDAGGRLDDIGELALLPLLGLAQSEHLRRREGEPGRSAEVRAAEVRAGNIRLEREGA